MAIKIRVDAKKMEDLLRNFYLIRIQNKEENNICRQFGAIDGMETE